MTSKQVMLAWAVLLIGGCSLLGPPKGADPLIGPYGHRQVWAVAPLRNESGSQYADGAALADAIARHLEGASNLDVLPVNRTLQAMDALKMGPPSNPAEAMRLLKMLGADGLVIGTVSAYDPYDPPKLGIALELYVRPSRHRPLVGLDVRKLSRAARLPSPPSWGSPNWSRQPVASVSAFLDAADPVVRGKLERYALGRGSAKAPDSSVLYRISMDLYSEFATYVMSWRLLRAETQRVAKATENQPVP